MIGIVDVSKSYGTVKAVNHVSLSVDSGILFGLIGPDGAGKTTLFRMITTLIIPDSGNIRVSGLDTVSDYRQIRQFTGYMPGRFSLYPDLTVEENLTFYATIFGTSIRDNYHLIKPVFSFLEPFSARLARNLSGGMKQKLALCCALIHNPKLLILDEPTTGVDAVSRKEFWETLNELKKTGMTILVSTPYMDEAAKCDRISLMQEGRIIIENTPGDILKAYNTPLLEVKTTDQLRALEILRSVKEITRAYLFGHSIHISLEPGSSDLAWLKSILLTHGIEGQVLTVEPDFEDCFIDAVEREKSKAL